MADFCWRCLEEGIYPDDPSRNDLYGLCGLGETAEVLCEGCGWVAVDHMGRPDSHANFMLDSAYL